MTTSVAARLQRNDFRKVVVVPSSAFVHALSRLQYFDAPGEPSPTAGRAGARQGPRRAGRAACPPLLRSRPAGASRTRDRSGRFGRGSTRGCTDRSWTSGRTSIATPTPGRSPLSPSLDSPDRAILPPPSPSSPCRRAGLEKRREPRVATAESVSRPGKNCLSSVPPPISRSYRPALSAEELSWDRKRPGRTSKADRRGGGERRAHEMTPLEQENRCRVALRTLTGGQGRAKPHNCWSAQGLRTCQELGRGP